METPPFACCLGPAPYVRAKLFPQEMALQLISQPSLASKPSLGQRSLLQRHSILRSNETGALAFKVSKCPVWGVEKQSPRNKAIISVDCGRSLPGKVRRVLSNETLDNGDHSYEPTFLGQETKMSSPERKGTIFQISISKRNLRKKKRV